MNERTPLLTTAKVARVLDVSPRTVRAMVRRGELRAIRIGEAANAKIRVRPEELDRFLARAIARGFEDAVS